MDVSSVWIARVQCARNAIARFMMVDDGLQLNLAKGYELDLYCITCVGNCQVIIGVVRASDIEVRDVCWVFLGYLST